MSNIRIKILGLLVTLLLFAGHCVAGEEGFTIAVASDSQETTGKISIVAARAPYFLVFDQDGNLLETVANPNANDAGGAGPRAAAFLADKNIKVVIAGRFGARMSNALKAANIQYIEKQGIIINEVKGVGHDK